MAARPHHYIFAHRALPAYFLEDPDRFFTVLERDGEQFLYHYWEHIGRGLDVADRLSPDGLWFDMQFFEDDFKIAIIAMPEPEFVPEAFMMAIIYQPALEDGFGMIARYFTLEYGYGYGPDEMRTVFCEWVGGAHSNYGDGPDPTPEDFLEHIWRFLTEE